MKFPILENLRDREPGVFLAKLPKPRGTSRNNVRGGKPTPSGSFSRRQMDHLAARMGEKALMRRLLAP